MKYLPAASAFGKMQSMVAGANAIRAEIQPAARHA
jgi:hypothetical protein